MSAPDAKEGPLNEVERAAYEAAMTENMLLRAVLDDLKGAGSHPASMSNRRKCELGERLRAATGRPLREITAFLRISRSSYEYWRARLSRPDKSAALRGRTPSCLHPQCLPALYANYIGPLSGLQASFGEKRTGKNLHIVS